MTRRSSLSLAGAAVLAAALPAAAYILPLPGILQRMGERRQALSLEALDVTASLSVRGPAAEVLARTPGVTSAAGQAGAPARFRMKVPGRCRLELASPDVPEASRPFVSVRADGRLSGAGGLDQVPAAAALVRALCALLGTHVAGDASGPYAAALSRRGVALGEASLGRFDGRIAYVIGGRARDAKPLLFVEKDGFRPLRLISQEGALWDVRLLGWGSPTGGDWFPRAVEVWSGDALLLRLTTERTVQNPKLAEALFP